MILGSTLFSFTNEWLTGGWTLSALLDRIASDRLGPGVEVVGFQSWRNFPDLDTAEVEAFRSQMDQLNLAPASLGVYADPGRRTGRMAGPAEQVDYLRPQIQAAARLGFPLLRMMLGTDLRVLEAMVPELEARHLTLTLEVQGSVRPGSRTLDDTLALLERLQTPALGLTLDFSLAMVDLPPTLRVHWRTLGLTDPIEQAFIDTWRCGGSGADFAAVASPLGASRELIGECAPYLFRLGNADPEQLRPLLPWVRHAHAKFWDLHDADTLVASPHGALIGLLAQSGYQGPLLSEWGGSSWLDVTDADAFDLTATHLQILRRELDRNQAAGGSRPDPNTTPHPWRP